MVVNGDVKKEGGGAMVKEAVRQAAPPQRMYVMVVMQCHDVFPLQQQR